MNNLLYQIKNYFDLKYQINNKKQKNIFMSKSDYFKKYNSKYNLFNKYNLSTISSLSPVMIGKKKVSFADQNNETNKNPGNSIPLIIFVSFLIFGTKFILDYKNN